MAKRSESTPTPTEEHIHAHMEAAAQARCEGMISSVQILLEADDVPGAHAVYDEIVRRYPTRLGNSIFLAADRRLHDAIQALGDRVRPVKRNGRTYLQVETGPAD